MTVRFSTCVKAAFLGLLIGNLGRIPVFSTGARDAPVLINDLFVAAVIALGGVQAVQRGGLKLDRVSWLALAFAFVGGVSTLYSMQRFGLTGFETLVSLGYLARWLFYFALYVVLINGLRSTDLSGVWRALEGVMLAFALFGIVQSIALPDFAFLVYPKARIYADWDPQGHRLVSTWLDPNFAVVFLLFGLLVQLAKLSMGEHVATWKPLVMGVGVLLTVSRAGLLALLAGLLVIWAANPRSRSRSSAVAVVAGVLLIGAPLAVLATGMQAKFSLDISALQRVIAWLRGLYVFSEHPIIGIGFNAWGFVQERFGYERMYTSSYSLDGGPIFVAVMTGAVGLALYTGMFASVIWRARDAWRSPAVAPEHRGLALGVAALTVAWLVHSLFANSLFYPFLMETVWVTWAMLRTLDPPSAASVGG